jgi:hypothetical protein
MLSRREINRRARWAEELAHERATAREDEAAAMERSHALHLRNGVIRASGERTPAEDPRSRDRTATDT